jgi:putative Mg2+ transporter-C (MgtC) family protein
MYFAALYALPAVARRLPRVGPGPGTLRLDYLDGRGVLRHVLEICTAQRFRVAEVSITNDRAGEPGGQPRVVSVALVLQGRSPVAQLAARLQEVDGMLAVRAGDSAGDG